MRSVGPTGIGGPETSQRLPKPSAVYNVPAGVTARLSLGKGVVLKGVSALVATFTRSSVWLVFSTQASGAACDDDTAAHAIPARTMRSAG